MNLHVFGSLKPVVRVWLYLTLFLGSITFELDVILKSLSSNWVPIDFVSGFFNLC